MCKFLAVCLFQVNRHTNDTLQWWLAKWKLKNKTKQNKNIVKLSVSCKETALRSVHLMFGLVSWQHCKELWLQRSAYFLAWNWLNQKRNSLFSVSLPANCFLLPDQSTQMIKERIPFKRTKTRRCAHFQKGCPLPSNEQIVMLDKTKEIAEVTYLSDVFL